MTSSTSANFSVVTFGQSTTIELPFTPDRVAYADEVRDVQVEQADGGAGSSLGRPVPSLEQALDRRARADDGLDGTGADRIPVLVLVSDGENTSPEPQAVVRPVWATGCGPGWCSATAPRPAA